MHELKEKILASGKLSEKKLEEKIKEKTEKFSGMLNQEAALFLIARELGTGIEKKLIKISEIEKGKTASIKAEILAVYPEREFESKGKKGKVKNVLIKDETGTAYLVLWNSETEKIKEEDKGKEIELNEFISDEFNGRIQLKKGFRGEMQLKEKTRKIKEKPKKISEIKEGEKGIVFEGIVLRKFPLKEFESKERKGMLKRIELIDETGIINLILWNEKAQEKIKEGKTIQLNELNARKRLKGIELHSTENTEIQEKEGKEKELKELCIKVLGKKELNKVVEGQRFIAEGKIKELNKTKLLFNVCPECSKSLKEEKNSFFCNNCGQVLKPEKKLVVSFVLEDETGEINSIVYGKKAEKIIEQSTEQTIQENEEKLVEDILQEIHQKIKGKKINFLAKAKKNSFTGETELVLEKLI